MEKQRTEFSDGFTKFSHYPVFEFRGEVERLAFPRVHRLRAIFESIMQHIENRVHNDVIRNGQQNTKVVQKVLNLFTTQQP